MRFRIFHHSSARIAFLLVLSFMHMALNAQHYPGVKVLDQPVDFSENSEIVITSDEMIRLLPGFNASPTTNQSLLLKISEVDEGSVPDSVEFLALKELYLNTDGDNWSNNTGWPTAAEFQQMDTDGQIKLNTDIANWFGVTVMGADVEQVLLPSNNLTGTIPSNVGDLADLKDIDLSGNNLTGTFPGTLTNVAQLSTLSIGQNQFTGFPDFGSNPNSANLTLDIADNQISIVDVEKNFTGVNAHPYSAFTYVPQNIQLTIAPVTFTVGGPLQILLDAGGNHTRYRWEKLDGATWVMVQENLSGDLFISTTTFSDVGTYRCMVSNDWATGITLVTNEVEVTESSIIEIELTASSLSSESIELNWAGAFSGANNFEVHRSLSSGTGYSIVTTLGGTVESYIDTGLEPNTTYYYKINALYSGSSEFSNESSCTTGPILTTSSNLEFIPQHNGNIAAIKWQHRYSDTEQLYTYQYDHLNRLTKAHYAQSSGLLWDQKQGANSVSQIDYDLNGNILRLERQAEAGIITPIDHLAYSYQGNQLTQVTDEARHADGFRDGNTNGDDYAYDPNGNMIRDANKDIISVEYNYLNLPEKVTKANGEYIKYIYDAAGTKLAQEVYDQNNTLTKRTDYIGEFVYEDDTLQFIRHDEGRVVAPAASAMGGYEYQYHLKDHLGNVRMTFTSDPLTLEYLATMESENMDFEEAVFDNMSGREVSVAANHTPDSEGILGNEAVSVYPGNPVGAAIMLPVGPGDVLDIETWAYYEGGSGYDDQLDPLLLVNAVAAAFTPASASAEAAVEIFNNVDNALMGNLGLGGSQGDQVPAAYLTYIYFDRDFNYIRGGYQGVTSAAENAQERVFMPPIDIEQSGWVYVYVSNESNTPDRVYFDDLKVVHQQSAVVQADDYFPFGLRFNEYQRLGMEENNYLFNDIIEIQRELNLNVYQSDFRIYNPALGRWWQIDPIEKFHESPYAWVTNNPILFSDPFGLDTLNTLDPDFNPDNIKDEDVVIGPNVLNELVIEASRELSEEEKEDVKKKKRQFAQVQNILRRRRSKNDLSSSNGRHRLVLNSIVNLLIKGTKSFIFPIEGPSDDPFQMGGSIGIPGRPVAGGGAILNNIPPTLLHRIQAVANKYNVRIALVGSRAKGTAHEFSDWDFIILGASNSKLRRRLMRQLPKNSSSRAIGNAPNEIINSGLDETRPHIIFAPKY